MTKNIYDIAVIGAGPSGNFAARELSSYGFKVVVFEEHLEIGLPLHCTGIVSEEVFGKFNIPRQSVLRGLKNFTVYSPVGEKFVFPEYISALVVDRSLFDKTIAEQAEDNGTKFYLNSKVASVKQNDDNVEIEVKSDGNVNLFHSKIAILATGAVSNLPKKSGMGLPRVFYQSIQQDAIFNNLDGAELYVGHHIAPGSFAYIVTTNGNFGKIGLISSIESKEYFDEFLKIERLKQKINLLVGKPKLRRIPMGISDKTTNQRIVSVGDSAGQAKTLTGGGVFYGLTCADILCKIIKGSYKKDNFVISDIAKYDKIWKEEIVSEIMTGLLVRNFFEQVDNIYLDRLIKLANKQKIKDIFSNLGNFDRHRKLIISLVKEPDVRKLFLEILRNNLPKAKSIITITDYLQNISFGLK